MILFGFLFLLVPIVIVPVLIQNHLATTSLPLLHLHTPTLYLHLLLPFPRLQTAHPPPPPFLIVMAQVEAEEMMAETTSFLYS